MAEGQARKDLTSSLVEEAHRGRDPLYDVETPGQRLEAESKNLEVLYPVIETDPVTGEVVLAELPDWPDVRGLLDYLDVSLGKEGAGVILSRIIRHTEMPPSAAYHLTLDRKEYVLILQPTDLPGRKRGQVET